MGPHHAGGTREECASWYSDSCWESNTQYGGELEANRRGFVDDIDNTRKKSRAGLCTAFTTTIALGSASMSVE